MSEVLVYGATIGGVAAAIRAARQGLSVTLVERSSHLGGLLSGGLGVMDTQIDGHRAPIYDELCERILGYYESTYGLDSQQYRNSAPREAWPLTAEPHVMEYVIDAMVTAEPGITVHRQKTITSVERAGRVITAVHLNNGERVPATTFIDATYEADLAALAGAEYRVGRESRSEFGEPHAGRIFTKQALTADGVGAWPREAGTDSLTMRRFKSISQEIFAGSTGEGDSKVQAYSYRLCLSSDPDNQVRPERPADYDEKRYRRLDSGAGIGAPNLPNGKRFWFRNLPGGSAAYPDGDEKTRDRVRAEHRSFALGYLWFLQHDETVAPQVQAEALTWGLAKDEFADNDNFPYELYVREARRLVGRTVFSELDASIAPGIRRTPIQHDSIAIAEWFMDSHEVSEETVYGSSREGKILLTELTRPSQVPYAALLPKLIDNLLVPVCMSATHVGWGTLRLEPVWAHVGESAGWAAVTAAESGVTVAAVDVAALQRTLADSGVALGYFNDVDVRDDEACVAAIQYFSTRGFFADYDARPHDTLTPATARAWVAAALGTKTAREAARAVAGASDAAEGVSGLEFDELILAGCLVAGIDIGARPAPAATPITRGDACRVLYELRALQAVPNPQRESHH